MGKQCRRFGIGRIARTFTRERVQCALAVAALFLVAISVRPAQAATHYVRAGADGDMSGRDWANAFPDLPKSFVRGDTYYIAAGTYRPSTFDTPDDGRFIVLRKATPADHGTAQGWRDSYGTGPAHWTTGGREAVWTFRTGHWEIDGATGGGPGQWDAGHGFKVSSTSQTPLPAVFLPVPGTSHVRIRHVEIDLSPSFGSRRGSVGIAVTPKSGRPALYRDIIVSHCYVHHVSVAHVGLNHAADCLFEYNLFAFRNTERGGPHGESFSCNYTAERANVTIRYNVFRDVAGTGYLVVKGRTNDGGMAFRDWHVYGNLFYETEPWSGTSNGTFAEVNSDDPATVHDSAFHNNTFVNLKGNTGIKARGTGNRAYNNLFFNCAGRDMIDSSIDHDYSWVYRSSIGSEPHLQSGSSDPFVDSGKGNFLLAAPTKPGKALPSPYGTDPFGTTRDAGTWDRGAFQFVRRPPAR